MGDREITTQRRVIRFSPDTLDYRYLGNWKDREENSTIEEALLAESLNCQGHCERVIPPPALPL